MASLPLLLDLSGRRVTIVGAGAVGRRRAASLHDAGAQVVLIDPAGSPISELNAAELAAEWIERPYRSGDLAGSWLVVAATNDPAVNEQVAADAEALRVFCIRADRADGGSARMPALLRHGDLTVSVNAGDDPLRARSLRDAIAGLLASGALAARPRRPASCGTVSLVGGGPGDPELITVRGRRLLFEADVVVTDRLAPRTLLEQLDPSVEIIDCGKSAHRHNLSQQQINEVIVARATAGKRVVRLKGGDPFVFGRGGEEVEACVAAGVPVHVVPGITSAIAAPAAAGIPLTHRGLAADFAVVSGHRDPGRAESGWNWAELAVGPATLVVLMGIDGLEQIIDELIKNGRPADTPAAAIHRATMPGQLVVRARLDELARSVHAAGLTAPAVVVIGAVAAFGQDSTGRP